MKEFDTTKWKTARLGDIATFNYGKGLVSTARAEGVVLVYGSSGVTGSHNEALVQEQGYIIGRKGSVGTIYYSEQPFWPIDTVYYVREKDLKCDFLFFYYLLQTLGLDKLNFDSAVPGLNRETAYALEFKIPESIDEQKQIASVLGCLDDKIELLKKENKTLEELAQTLFKHWFVDFEFPDRNNNPYKSTQGKLKDSPLGPIPENWHVGKLSDFGKVICGKTPSKSQSEYFGGGIPFIKIPDMRNMYVVETQDSLTETGADTQKGKTVPASAICVSCIATVGLVSIVTKDSQTNQQINTVIPSNNNLLEYLYFRLQSSNDTLQAIGAGGSATLNVNTSQFSNLPLLMPSESVLSKYHNIVSVQFEKIKLNSMEVQNLSKVRDELLGKIFSA